MEAISRSCLPEAAARTKRQRKATCCGVLGAPSHRTTCSRSSAAKLTSGLLLAMRTHISYWPQYVYLFMIHTTSPGTSTLYCVGLLQKFPYCSGAVIQATLSGSADCVSRKLFHEGGIVNQSPNMTCEFSDFVRFPQHESCHSIPY